MFMRNRSSALLEESKEKIQHAECYIVKRTCGHVESYVIQFLVFTRNFCQSQPVYTKLCLLMRIAKTTRETCPRGKSQSIGLARRDRNFCFIINVSQVYRQSGNSSLLLELTRKIRKNRTSSGTGNGLKYRSGPRT